MPLEMEREIKNKEIAAYVVNHLPIVKEFATKLGLVEMINKMMSPCKMEVEPGVIFLGLILDTLSGRTPLYRLDEFFANQDIALLLDRDVSSEYFADHNVTRVLDRAHEIGSIKIFTEIAKRGVSIFGVNTDHVSFDTTSMSVFGDYDFGSSGDNGVLNIKHGHSKDHRPDLKQFLISMLCVNRNIPVFGQTEDGNASDKKLNNEVLSSVSKHMTKYGLKPGAFIYIADSAMVTEDNLKVIGNDIRFITRLPATYNECDRVIKEAVAENQWNDIGVLAVTKPTKNRPAAYYKSYESEVDLYGKTYRAIVISSSAHDKRRQKRINRELKKSQKALKTQCKELKKEEFFCRADAQKAADKLQSQKSKYYLIKAEVKEVPKYKKGRPKGGVKEIREMRYVVEAIIEEKKEGIEKFRKEAGCFVLISNVQKEGEGSYDSRAVLKAYKDQYGIENNFGFLKDPAIVNGIFIKRPERIEVLGLVLLLSLLIWRLIEYSMRKHVEESGEDLPGWKKARTKRPTSFMLTTKFVGITVIKVGNKRILNKPLTPQQKEYLNALGVSQETFVNPRDG